MGVQGLQTFVTENALLVSHRLQDTVLIIDGLNLENELYRAFLKSHDDKAYGGDYTHLTLYVEDFFKSLQECGVQPVVIMDGSFEVDKLETKKERFNYTLDCAHNIFQGKGVAALEVNSLLNPHVFVQTVKRLGVSLYKSIFEADDILPQIAIDLGAPILSNDSDFLVENLPAGVISPKSLLLPNLTVQSDYATGKKYILCQIYKLESLQREFPGLKPELVPIGGAILGNDYLSYHEARQIIQELPPPPFSHSKYRQYQIYQVFWWLSTQPSIASVLSQLKLISGSNQLIRCIEDRYLNPAQSSFGGQLTLSVGEYFTRNGGKLFKRQPGVPQWAHDALVEERLQRRVISILHGQVEFFRPLVEDFNLEQSSYETVFELCSVIYGLLRSDDSHSKKVTRFYRRGYARQEETVQPTVQIANKRLPVFTDIDNLPKTERIALFYQILGIPSSIKAELKSMLPSDLSSSTIDQLTTLLLSAIYLCRHFSTDIGLEFVYALATNLLLMGHFTDNDRVPAVLKLSKGEHDKLLSSLKVFDVLPSRAKGYQARIVHQYNAFQNCFNNIAFLAQILDLADVFHADHLFSGLQGTFLYNLTVDLSSRDKPLLHLEEALLGGSSFKYVNLFQNVLDLLLKSSDRKFISTDNSTTQPRDIIPVNYQVNKFATSKDDQLFVRGLNDAAEAGGLSNLGDIQKDLEIVRNFVLLRNRTT